MISWTKPVLLAALLAAVAHWAPAAETPDSRPANAPVELRKLMDAPLRDPSICVGPDGTYYLTGTSEPFWGYNNENGIRVGRSKDMATCEPFEFFTSPTFRDARSALDDLVKVAPSRVIRIICGSLFFLHRVTIRAVAPDRIAWPSAPPKHGNTETRKHRPWQLSNPRSARRNGPNATFSTSRSVRCPIEVG